MQYPEYNNNNLSSMNINTLLADTSNVISEVQVANNNSSSSCQEDIQHPQYSVLSHTSVPHKANQSIDSLSPISKFVATGDVSGVSNMNNSSVRPSNPFMAEKINTEEYGHREKKRQLYAPNSTNSISYVPQGTSFNESLSRSVLHANPSKNSNGLLRISPEDNDGPPDAVFNSNSKTEILQLLSRLLEMSQTVDLKLSDNTLEELSTKLNEIQSNDSS